ncbi:hypothetical protein [Noviherbaspirillum pedocola]|uniref:Uncharacterized protein n=1 Tax=Noviherbaspirillum pedocola TaxID=2801341 RepID=A0A934W526_9BURK|nr:hypothetical protein [Noviherbaspirillum pedocola]MBK4739166.1 hypothetical protein [Noviherbaspirillum pedocola]
MAAMRLSPTEVQVSGVVYTFVDADVADEFEECINMIGALSCELEHRPVSKRLADSRPEEE